MVAVNDCSNLIMAWAFSKRARDAAASLEGTAMVVMVMGKKNANKCKKCNSFNVSRNLFRAFFLARNLLFRFGAINAPVMDGPCEMAITIKWTETQRRPKNKPEVQQLARAQSFAPLSK
jgi:hypothetical protein